MSQCRLLTSLAMALVVASRAGAQSASPPRIPDSPVGRAYSAWLNGYNGSDSAALVAYARQYEPEMDAPMMLIGRRNTGGLDVRSIERSDAGHLELTLTMRRKPTLVYQVFDLVGNNPGRVVSMVIVLGDSIDSALLRIDRAGGTMAIDSLAAKMNRHYVYPAVAQAIVDSVRARNARGAYDDITNQIAFAQRLRVELLEISHDKHISVNFFIFAPPTGPTLGPGSSTAGPPRPAPSPAPAPMPPPGGPPSPMMRPPCSYESSLLDGNVGYIKFDTFRDPAECGADASRAMQAIADSRALIVDLRGNRGGSPYMVAYLASYLVDRRTHLNDVWTRSTGVTEEFWTRDDVPGPRFGAGKPVFVLTSPTTFSAAEAFAYDLQSLKRATIVGETTGGGAHLTGSGPIGEHLLLTVPLALTINPITKTDWEGTGVVPDVKVPAGDALTTALKLARDRRH